LVAPAVAAVVVPLVVLGPTTIAWAASDGASSIEPAPLQAAPPRSIFSYDLGPRHEVADAVQLTNTTSAPQSFELYAADGYDTSAGGEFALRSPNQPKVGVGAWVYLPSTSVTVPPHSNVLVPFVLSVPPHVSPGDHMGGIVALEEQPAVVQRSTARLLVRTGVGVRILLRVPGPLSARVSITAVHVSESVPPLSFLTGSSRASVKVALANTGNTVLSGVVHVAATDSFGRTVARLAPVRLDALVPGARTTIAVPQWKHLPLLGPTIGMHVRVDARGATASADARFLDVPWVLLLVVVVCLLALVAGLWRVRRHRRARGVTVDDCVTRASASAPSHDVPWTQVAAAAAITLGLARTARRVHRSKQSPAVTVRSCVATTPSGVRSHHVPWAQFGAAAAITLGLARIVSRARGRRRSPAPALKPVTSGSKVQRTSRDDQGVVHLGEQVPQLAATYATRHLLRRPRQNSRTRPCATHKARGLPLRAKHTLLTLLAAIAILLPLAILIPGTAAATTPTWAVMSSPDTTIGSPAAPTENHLKGVAALSATDVWAVGYYNSGTSSAPLYQTLIEHYDGTSWQVDPSSADQTVGSPATSTDNELLGIAATSATDVWAVGYYNAGTSSAPLYQTLIEHYDGTSWQVDPSPDTTTAQDNVLTQVAAVSSSDLWAVGSADIVSDTQTVSQTLVEGTPTPSTTDISSSANPSVAGQQLTLTASVSGSSSFTPTGTVMFTSNGIVIAGCDAVSLSTAQAQCTTTFAGAGFLSFQALYSGDDNFLTSSATLSQTVNRDATTTTVAVSSTSVAVGQSVAVMATVAPLAPGAGTQTGTVEFEDSGNVVDECNAQSLALGVATCFTSFSTAGTHTLAAVYNGDANFDTSTSNAVVVTVGVTTTTLASSANPSVAGDPVTYTATVAPQVPGGATPTGAVEFEDSGTVVDGCSAQSLVEAVATCNVVYPLSSTHTITAIYSGSTDHLASTSTDLTQTVGGGTLALSESTAPSAGTPFIIDLSPVLLGSRQFEMSTGQLGTLQVDDNRGTESGWSTTAQLESDFINEQPSGAVADNTIPGDFLTSVPDVTAAVDGASMSGVSAGPTSTLSNTTAVPLCSAAQGFGGSDYDCGASLSLSVPPYAAAGTYVATLDIVLTSN
jgi:hypothetical protein